MDLGLRVALRLTKEGYAPTPLHVLEMPTDVVISALEHSEFAGDWSDAFVELNKDTK